MSRYEKTFRSTSGEEFRADVYAVLVAFNVTCPARQHAIKKLLMPGQRGSKGEVQDLDEALWSVSRAVDMACARRRGGHGASDVRETRSGGTLTGETETEPEPIAEPERRLYVWREFAPDYKSGLAVAVAESVDEAKRLVVGQLGFEPDDWGPVTTYTLSETVAAWAVTGGQ